MILYMKMGNRNEKEQQQAFEMVHQAEKKKHNATETLFIKIPRVFRWDREKELVQRKMCNDALAMLRKCAKEASSFGFSPIEAYKF